MKLRKWNKKPGRPVTMILIFRRINLTFMRRDYPWDAMRLMLCPPTHYALKRRRLPTCSWSGRCRCGSN